MLSALLFVALPLQDAFQWSSVKTSKSKAFMIGGRGWDNNDYLGGLSGDDEEREKVQEEYQDFSQRRKAFMERQQQILNTPQGKAFMEQQQQQLGKMKPGVESGDFDFEDELANIEPGSGGGSRMAQMMAQAKRMQRLQQPGQQGGMMGFEQKFAIPLDEDEDEKEEQ